MIASKHVLLELSPSLRTNYLLLREHFPARPRVVVGGLAAVCTYFGWQSFGYGIPDKMVKTVETVLNTHQLRGPNGEPQPLSQFELEVLKAPGDTIDDKLRASLKVVKRFPFRSGYDSAMPRTAQFFESAGPTLIPTLRTRHDNQEDDRHDHDL